jgi:hypothetical protein
VRFSSHRGKALTMNRGYRVLVAERIDPAWSAWLHNLVIIHNKDGSTALVGVVDDCEMLLSVLVKLIELGATLIGVEPVCASCRPVEVESLLGKEMYK